MEREEQIDEIAKIIDDNHGFIVSSVETAEALYNAGYRKVEQGEWIKHGYKWKCTHCGVLMNVDGTPKENMLFYCPNCGAHMKGAE